MNCPLLLALALTCVGQASSTEPICTGTRRALILCGLPGDESHRAMYAQSVEKLHKALVGRYGFSPEEVWVRFGSKPENGDGPALAKARGLSTREAIEADVAELRKGLQPEDALWVIVLGHAHYDGRHSWLNLPGPDVQEEEFGKLFAGLASREQVFLITTPASGFLIKHLSARGRIVITATEPDWEVNETLFHLPPAEVLSNPPRTEKYDQDKDGRITVLDLYLLVTRLVMMMYQAEKDIPTEHAQLDDNGDGRGTELQLDYLEPELGGRARPRGYPGARPRIKPSADGALAATVVIHMDPIPEIRPAPATVPAPEPLPEPPSASIPHVDPAKESH
jgi:hypothetical protein